MRLLCRGSRVSHAGMGGCGCAGALTLVLEKRNAHFRPFQFPDNGNRGWFADTDGAVLCVVPYCRDLWGLGDAVLTICYVLRCLG